MVHVVLKRRPSAKNPNYCDVCETFVRTHPGGAEVEVSVLFADVRGSTALAEQMRPAEFSRLMNRFFDRASRVVIDSDGSSTSLSATRSSRSMRLPSPRPPHERRSRPPATSCARPPSHPEHVSCAADALAALEESLPQASARVAGSGRCQVVPPVLLVTLSGA